MHTLQVNLPLENITWAGQGVRARCRLNGGVAGLSGADDRSQGLPDLDAAKLMTAAASSPIQRLIGAFNSAIGVPFYSDLVKFRISLTDVFVINPIGRHTGGLRVHPSLSLQLPL